MFTGKKPEVSHLKIFGCPLFIHILKETSWNPPERREYLWNICEVSKVLAIFLVSGQEIETRQ
jgi:hypothetical protein